MKNPNKIVDGFKFLPPGLRTWVKSFIPEDDFKGNIPWTPMQKPLNQVTISFITSAGISLKSDPPFDMERGKREPLWGDRSFRKISKGTIEKDINVILPLQRLAEFEKEGIIGRLAPTSYSIYGFQWKNTDFLKEAIEPISILMKTDWQPPEISPLIQY